MCRFVFEKMFFIFRLTSVNENKRLEKTVSFNSPYAWL